MNKHKHHIIPIYRCKELGMTTSYKIDGVEFYFKENMVEIEQIDHALIHWGYYCDDLTELLKHCNPEQWIIDLIPRGDYRDSHAAIPNALGAIGGIEPARGKDCPDYIPVVDLAGNEVEGSEDWPGKRRSYYRECVSEGRYPITHEQRAVIREEKEISYRKAVEERKLEIEERRRIAMENAIENDRSVNVKSVESLEWYHKQKEKGVDPNKKYRESHREENKVYAKWYYHNVQKSKNAKKKAETQGEGTLDAHMG